MDIQERIPLLQEEIQPELQQSNSKQILFGLLGQETNYKCWACWETMSSNSNPLIRVCKGCKGRKQTDIDPELQYIHQNCINSYITSLPQPRRPRSPRQQNLTEFLEQGSETEVYYDCTRCRDPYVVEERTLFPLVVIWQDTWLRVIFILLVIACIVMIGTCITIATSNWDSDIFMFDLFGYKITVITMALALTLVGLASGIGLFISLWVACSDKKRLHVIGEQLLI
jgi:DNA-directed RNA polymerase subunit RPC12/RpoP